MPIACRALPSSGDYCQILSVKELFLLVNRRGRREWRLFPPPTDPKIIEIWLNLRFISSEVRLLVGNNAQPGVIVLLATNRGAPKQRLSALCRTMGNFVLPNFSISLPTRLFFKKIAIQEYSRLVVEDYSNFGVRTGPRKTPPFLPPRGRSLFLP